MKERILDRIYKELENGETEHLRKQIRLLPTANISTLHSFCFSLVKEYFYKLDIPFNISIGETEELAILETKALDNVLSDEYDKKEACFINLVNSFSEYRNDKKLNEIIKDMASFFKSIAFQEEWLENILKELNEKHDDFSKSKYGKIIFPEVYYDLRTYIYMLENQKNIMSLYPKFIKCKETLENDIDGLNMLLRNSTWDDMFYALQSFEMEDWPRIRIKSDEKDNAKNVRNHIKDEINDRIKAKYFVGNSEEVFKDILETIPYIKKIFEIYIKFKEEYTKLKAEKKLIDFDDLERLTLKLLVEQKDGIIYKTAIAKEISNKYYEIQVDEYQDINETQELIIWAVSNNNIFRVGDVKQSIYGFRNANPFIFLNHYKNFSNLSLEDDNKDDNKKENSYNLSNNISSSDDFYKQRGRKILLSQNFRSRKNVIDFCNELFSKIMSEKLR